MPAASSLGPAGACRLLLVVLWLVHVVQLLLGGAVPPGFAHGFLVLSESAEFLYKTTDYWYPKHERSLLWNDPALAVDWPLPDGIDAPVLAAKDAVASPLAQAPTY